MDYAKWARRLGAFVRGLQRRSPAEYHDKFSIEVAPPLGEDELDELAEALDCGLPPSLRKFLGTGSSSISFQYAWPPEDDESCDVFCPADELADWRQECVEYAADSWLTEPDWPLDRAFWRHALPLVHYPDGDGVALWVHDADDPDPPVVYLKHEDQSLLLSRNLDDFLTQWEGLGYVGANDLEPFRNPKTGFLDASLPKAVALRKKWEKES